MQTVEEVREWLLSLPDDQRERVLKEASLLPPVKPGFAEFAAKTSGFTPHSWQANHLFPIFEELTHERGVRYLVHGPPQFGKSMWAEERLPAYALGHNPLWKVRTACYNITTATKFGGIVKQIMESDDYVQWFGEDAKFAKGGEESFYTAARFKAASGQPSFSALGLETGLVGTGPDLLIIGDPYSGPEQVYSAAYAAKLERFFHQSLLPRVTKDTNILVLYHKWHDSDLASIVKASRLGFQEVRFPGLGDDGPNDPTGRAKDEPLSPLRTQEELMAWREHDPGTFYALCQGMPLPQDGRVFKPEDFEVVDEVPDLKQWYRGWDIASSTKETADFTAGALIGVDTDLTIYIKDVVRFRKEFPDARAHIIATAQQDGKETLLGIEEKVAGLAMVQDILRVPEMLGHAIYPMPAKGDKKQRANGWAARARAGRVKLLRGPWNTAFINECLAFDGLGLTHDDQVDAVSIAFSLLHMHRGGKEDPEPTYEPGTYAYYEKLAEIYGGSDEDSFGSDGDPSSFE